MNEHSLRDETEVRALLAEFEAEAERILPRNNYSLPFSPHEGPPNMTPERALELYRENRSERLSRTVMTDEQRANFVGDAK